MRQLLSCSGQYVVVGWGNRAFAGRLDSSQVLELEPSSPDPSAQVVDQTQAREVQAVSIFTLANGNIWCAVARYDKSLCLYAIDNGGERAAGHGEQPVILHPRMTYKTSKRVTSLCFATVKDTEKSSNDLTVVIAADLAGDAVAFSLESVAADGDAKDDASSKNNHHRRLLLGHTATMLTCVLVSLDSTGQQRIFTADRDEKIRVSSFPNTHVIEGFLLGHEAFVACLDVAQENALARCVSCSGDGSVRMWDYLSMEELGKFEIAKDGADKECLPTRVVMNGKGDAVIVCVDGPKSVQVLCWKETEKFFEPRASPDDAGTVLASTWVDKEKIITLANGPQHIRAHCLPREEEETVVLDFEFLLLASLNKLAADGKLVLPTSILERDEFGTLKMRKQEERRVNNTDRAWNDAARVDVAKERDRRYKKRKKDRQDGGAAETDENEV